MTNLGTQKFNYAKVYFSASVAQRKNLNQEYRKIVESISDLGYEVLMAFDVLEENLEYILKQGKHERHEYYKNWMKTIRQCEVAVIEMSFPSTVNIGVELSSLLERNIPVVALYKQGKDPTFVDWYFSNRIIPVEYGVDDVKGVLEWALEEAERLVNRRFTFYIDRRIEGYLDELSKNTGLSKSEIIRGLIEKESEGERLSK